VASVSIIMDLQNPGLCHARRALRCDVRYVGLCPAQRKH
jgi:hypothetical protein